VAAEGLLEAALILSVDHELNVSSFTARCVASAGSTPYAAVGAGLAAIQGIHHGGHSERMEALLAEAGAARGDPNVEVPATIAGRLRRGEPVPGFGHPLYPGGDPRCRELFRRIAADFPGTEAAAFADALATAGRDLLGEHPNVDAGLAVTARALGLPRGSALVIFALGRTVGWIGHAVEQYREGRLIRPRARYVGERPEEEVG
jgi:citrate synthase